LSAFFGILWQLLAFFGIFRHMTPESGVAAAIEER